MVSPRVSLVALICIIAFPTVHSRLCALVCACYVCGTTLPSDHRIQTPNIACVPVQPKAAYGLCLTSWRESIPYGQVC
ncbi:hypothetical protein GGS21DRAFT_501395 [Xylaria nigripes]|nr:hypothetical protein GGS21DRAFT_501395 [Xylaria nigripes]